MPSYQLLVRTKDKINDKDPVKNAGLTKRGDVIAIKPAETAWWTPTELSNPEWTVIKAELTKDAAESLLAPELPPDLNKTYAMLRKRALKIDLDSLAIATGETREDPKDELATATIIEAVIVKERLAEPDELA